MRKPSNSSLKRVQIIGFSLVVILVPFIVYYYFWVSRQTRYYTGRDIRVLAALTRHVEESVNSQSKVFTNAVEKYLRDLHRTAREEDPDQTGAVKGSTAYQKLQNGRDELKRQFQTISLDPLKADGTNLTITDLDVLSKPPEERSTASPRIDIRYEDSQRFLYFSYTTKYPPQRTELGDDLSEGKGITPVDLNFVAKTNLAGLIGQFVDKRRIEDSEDSYGKDGFDAIVIAELSDSVDVIFEETSAKLRLSSLSNLTASDGSKLDLKLLGQATNMVDVKVGTGEYKLFFQPLQLPVERLGGDKTKQIRWLTCGFVESSRFRSETWAVSYMVLIIFGFIAALVALSWPFLKLLLIGPKDRLRPIDTYLLVVSTVMVSALLTVFGVFSVSYLRTEKQLDDELANFSGELKRRFDHEVKLALQAIDALNCDKKLWQSAQQLDPVTFYDSSELLQSPRSLNGSDFRLPAQCRPTESVANANAEQPTPTPRANDEESGHNSEADKSFTSPKPPSVDRRLILADGAPEHYPYLISAFWADWHGRQQIKWTTRQNLTNNVSVADREYFFKLRQKQPYTLKDDNNNKEHKFYLQPIVSKTTGRSEVVITKAIFPFEDAAIETFNVEEERLKAEQKEKAEQNQKGDSSETETEPDEIFLKSTEPSHKDFMWISAISTRLLSLMDPVVPSGFGFAVIDDAGVVLFHSDEKRHLRENFFEESDNNQLLRAAVLGRSERQLAATYLGKDHSMFVRPVDGDYRWTVIAFRNKEYLRTTFSEILALCLVLFFTYLVFTLIVLLAVYLINRTSRDPVTWLWPAPNKTRIYMTLLLLNFMLVLISVMGIWLGGLKQIVIPVISSIAAIFLYVWILKSANESHLSTKLIARLTQRSVLNHRTVYTLNAALVFTLISIIPAYASFKVACAQEMKLFIKDGQLDFARSMAQRQDRLRALYVNPNLTSDKRQSMEEFFTQRVNDTSKDVYDSLLFETKLQYADSSDITKEPPQQNDNWLVFFRRWVPILNQNSVHHHAMMSSPADGSWSWEERSDKLILKAPSLLVARHEADAQLIVSGFPNVNGAGWWFVWPVLLIIVFQLVAYMFSQIFLFKRNETAADRLNGFTAESVSQNLFLVLNPPFIGRRALLRRLGFDKAAFERIDVQRSADVKKWVTQCNTPALRDPSKISRSTLPVILDNFDYSVENPTYNQQRLSLLEKLLEQKRVAIAVSNLGPDKFVNGNGDSASQNGASGINMERWTGAVSRFVTVSLEDFGDATALKTTLRNRKKEIEQDKTLSGEDLQRIESVFERIERECSPRACLQSIGEGIANDRDIKLLTPEGVTKQVLEQALPYYKFIWRVCSNDEKLTMSHLAQDGLLSSNDPDIDRLMQKGLIVRKPAVKLMNESFKSFVLTVEHGDALAECEAKAKKDSHWHALKVPLSIGVASVIVFLFLTQRELYNSTLPIITAITAGVPTFFKLVSVLHGDGPGKAGG